MRKYAKHRSLEVILRINGIELRIKFIKAMTY